MCRPWLRRGAQLSRVLSVSITVPLHLRSFASNQKAYSVSIQDPTGGQGDQVADGLSRDAEVVEELCHRFLSVSISVD